MLKSLESSRSNKDRRLEIMAVVITGLLKFVLMDWLQFRMFYIVAACLFWLVFIYRKYRRDPLVLKSWGFQRANLKQSLLVLLPFALVGIGGIVVYGLVRNVSFLNWHVIPIFVLYPVWGIIQQFMIVGLVAGNLKTLTDIRMSDSQIVLFTALLFSLVHYPIFPLMVYAFVMEYIFIRIYFKWGNLWSIGLYHGWVSSLFLFFVSGRDLWNEMLMVFHKS